MSFAATLKVGAAMCRPGHEAPLGAAAISIAAGRIAAIETIEADLLAPSERGLVALPAPVDAHDHGRGLRSFAVGAADDALEIWLAALVREPRIDPYLRAAVAFARLVEGGVCAANHCHNTQDRENLVAEAEAVARAARDVGLRVAFAVPIIDRHPLVYGELAPLLEGLSAPDRAAIRLPPVLGVAEMLARVEAISGFEHPLFRVQYGPVGPQWVSNAAMAAVAEASARDGRRVHLHLFETERQRQWADHAYPGGLVRHLDTIGLLSPRLTVAHGVWLRPDECALLAERGVCLSVNVSSNLRLRSGLPPVERFAAAGLPIGVGLDGMALDDDEDMLREMRLVWHLYRAGGIAPADPAMAFDAAGVVGRRSVLGEDGGGVLAPGAPADVLLLDRAAMAADCVGEPADLTELLLTRMTKRFVRGLMISGSMVVRDAVCQTVDLPALQRQLLAQASTAPPNPARISRLQGALRRYYQCRCHLTS